MQDLFRKWDCDRSNSISKGEFRSALAALKVVGTTSDYDSLFDAWDVDGNGTLVYTEVLVALSGTRYDAFRERGQITTPPLVVFAPADPFTQNPRFLDDVALLGAVARVEPLELPPYTPLGLSRGEVPASTDLPSWARPEIHCDPSGAPQQRALLPIGATWRTLFGEARPLPLWIGYVPGHAFAVSRTAAFRAAFRAAHEAEQPGREPEKASAFYARALRECGLGEGRAPAAGVVFERLWRHVFVADG